MHRHNVFPLSTVLLVAANLLIPVAIVLFAIGFFPYKPFLPGLAEYNSFDYGPPPEPPFDRLIFMVIDALRSDFVFTNNSGFHFTQGLISDGLAVPFTAHATSPTITMPRIKAITTGSTPSFLDAILSFDEADTSSTLAAQDTWLAQMKAKKSGKLVMYGDDTWLKLFPGLFDRADGTSSFFVSDFTEVDNNVTRHIPDELRNDDWNTMVLHYLGLDHIGHKTGPRGPNMIPKQHEMDDIVRMIYEAIKTQPHLQSTLLVICGDHGMNDAGNHGASSPGETSAALVFVSPKLKSVSNPVKVPADLAEDFQHYGVVEQSDLAPTLAALLGFPVPKNSLGSFILQFLSFWPERHDKRQILLRNTRQILDIVAATYIGSPFTDEQRSLECAHPGSVGEELICEWQNISKSVEEMPVGTTSDDWIMDASKWLSKAQTLMSSVASNYDMSMLTYGGLTTALASILATYALTTSPSMTASGLVPFVLITTLYGIMMFASSYVEEEQHFWYWATSAWLLYLTIRSNPKMTHKSLATGLVILGSMRLVRGWNQTGQKFAGEPDIVTSFVAANPPLLWCLVVATYAMVSSELFNGLGDIPAAISGSVVAGLVTSAISFKLAFTNEDAPELVVGLARTLVDIFDGPSLVNRARAVFLGLGLTLIYPLHSLLTSEKKSSKEKAMRTLHHLYTLFALTQSRVTNIPLFLLFQAIYLCLSHLRLSVIEITISSLLLQFSSFFAMGGSNAISGVDLSSAYNGVSGFNIIAVGALTFLSNWAAPVWWTSALNLLLLRRQSVERDHHFLYRQHTAILTIFVTVTLGFVMMACTALRTHLFIWTVFSPKYLYSMAWSLGQHMIINVVFGGFLCWLGRT
ncbi:alkaline phosphatase-like protein [Annulohypoxylon maeteangense]|uniref:alkaline phosphatase-like protein n=1 Tax=Annulohypoxylon maeteangense TaxID=1927788 RepID=UPI00200854E9|nr:alkaline phosphatase-like protein [Annulohypoxylon maeteangense]KAI0880833.1 alkaline phosphatase-like protein [Annulohypoxylon maeteangense]